MKKLKRQTEFWIRNLTPSHPLYPPSLPRAPSVRPPARQSFVGAQSYEERGTDGQKINKQTTKQTNKRQTDLPTAHAIQALPVFDVLLQIAPEAKHRGVLLQHDRSEWLAQEQVRPGPPGVNIAAFFKEKHLPQ